MTMREHNDCYDAVLTEARVWSLALQFKKLRRSGTLLPVDSPPWLDRSRYSKRAAPAQHHSVPKVDARPCPPERQETAKKTVSQPKQPNCGFRRPEKPAPKPVTDDSADEYVLKGLRPVRSNRIRRRAA